MKNQTLRLLTLMSLALATLGVSTCKPRRAIVILPSPHTKEKVERNWNAISQKLQTYDTYLYRIQNYRGGEPVGEQRGSLPHILLERSVDEFNDLAMRTKYTGHAFQVGVGLHDASADYRYIGEDHATGEAMASSHSHHVRSLSGKTSSHAHLIHLFEQSEGAVSEIEPLVDESESSDH